MRRRPFIQRLSLTGIAASVRLAVGEEKSAMRASGGAWEALDAAILKAVELKEIPGAVLWVERLEQKPYAKAYGWKQTDPSALIMKLDTIFDLASLTKVIATAPSIMVLVDQGKLALGDKVSRHLSEFTGDARNDISILQLLTHVSGLPPSFPRELVWSGEKTAVELACKIPLKHKPGEAFVYSDIGFILLGETVRRVSGKRLDEFAKTHLFDPLDMRDTSFLPVKKLKDRIAPTTREAEGENGLVHGFVHDPTCRRMGGVAGHAGLFGTAADLARYCRMLLSQGFGPRGKKIISSKSMAAMTAVQTPASISDKRGLGWDIDSTFSDPRGAIFPKGTSFGHTGWTGTSVWMDPQSKCFVILLSNRNHPAEKGTVRVLRYSVGTLAAKALGLQRAGGGSAAPRTETALNGVDVLAKYAGIFNGMKLGLVTNHTGRDRNGVPTIDMLAAIKGAALKALFSPEHGIRGVQDQKIIADATDEKTGLPIHSLYGKNKRPTAAQLAGLTALVFDVQDIGARFYTYISTMREAMVAAAKAGLKFIVLDRINPINGKDVEGPVSQGAPSILACHPIPIRHGMTVGELAMLINAEKKLGLDLEVVKVENWKRGQWQDETGLPWVSPSPNMRSLHAATLYPGICLLEFCNISVGRGTGQPFELVGAPWVNSGKLMRNLLAANIPGIGFEETKFTPKSRAHAGEQCSGIKLRVEDRNVFKPVRFGLALALVLQKEHARSLNVGKMDQLLVHPKVLAAIRRGDALAEIEKIWEPETLSFLDRRKAFLMYPET